jgi:hypothetical protein
VRIGASPCAIGRVDALDVDEAIRQQRELCGDVAHCGRHRLRAGLTRPVDTIGRNAKMTLVIARLQFEIRAFAGAAAHQFDPPAGTANARDGQRR